MVLRIAWAKLRFFGRNHSGYYFTAPQSDWTAPHNDALWQENLKTLFDPCPAGWRVPKGGQTNPWQALYTETHAIVSGTWDVTNKGLLWTVPGVYGGNAWYPASGLRGQGELGDYGSRGLFWTGMSSSYFNVAQNDTFINGAPLVYGFSVRCVRE